MTFAECFMYISGGKNNSQALYFSSSIARHKAVVNVLQVELEDEINRTTFLLSSITHMCLYIILCGVYVPTSFVCVVLEFFSLEFSIAK